MPRNKIAEPYFKTVFYKDVELFIHRDTTTKPAKLRLYDALSGWVIAAGMTKAEARYLGIQNPAEGKNEEELIQILENKLTAGDMKGESFKELITRRRGDNPPREEQQEILKAYIEATATKKKAELEPMKAPVTTKVAIAGDPKPRKEIIKMPGNSTTETSVQSRPPLWGQCSSTGGCRSGQHPEAHGNLDTHPSRHPDRRSRKCLALDRIEDRKSGSFAQSGRGTILRVD